MFLILVLIKILYYIANTLTDRTQSLVIVNNQKKDGGKTSVSLRTTRT